MINMPMLHVQFVENLFDNSIDVLDNGQLIMCAEYNKAEDVSNLTASLVEIVRLHNANKHLELVEYAQRIFGTVRKYRVQSFAKDGEYIESMCLSAKYIIGVLDAIIMHNVCNLNVAAQQLYEHTLCGEVVRTELPPAPSRIGQLVGDITKYVLGPMLNAVPGEFVPLNFGSMNWISFFKREGAHYVSRLGDSFQRGRYVSDSRRLDSFGEDARPHIPGDDDDYVMLNGRLYGHNACHYVLPKLSVSFSAVCGGYAYGETALGLVVRVRIGNMCRFPCRCCETPELEPTRVRNPIDSQSHYYYNGRAVYVLYYGETAPHMIVPSHSMHSFGRMPIGDAYYILDSRGLGIIPILH